MQASRVGVVVDVVLCGAKGAVAISSGSAALAADAAHSVADVVSSAIVYVCVQNAREPPDHDHPYGHGKIQSLGTLAVAAALLFTR
jgi:cation diffusion facilitator family transporter